MSSVIDTPQHYIPLGGSSPSLNLSYIRGLLGANTSSTPSRTVGLAGSSGGAGIHSIPYSVMVSLLIVILVVVILYLMITRYGHEEGIVKAEKSLGLAYSYSVPYSYPGRKRVLRQLFERIRGRMASSPEFSEGLTVKEIALLLDPSNLLKRFADIYNMAVFSPREPSEEEVQEAENVVSAWENNTIATSDF